MRTIVTTVLFVFFFGFFGVVNAQLGSALPQTEVNVEMTPDIPGPNETIFVSLTSYGTNLNSANITWSVNGKDQKSGMGEKTFTFKVGDTNSTTNLNITILTQEGETIEKNMTIRPVSVDLIWESDGFTPPFYKGKTLFSHQNKITLIALPHILSSEGVEISSKNLIYTWKKNGSVMQDVSGFGKNSYSYVSPLISRPATISVEVTTIDNSGLGFAKIDLAPSEPKILFYRKNPVDGIQFQKALSGNVDLGASREIIVVGVPLFFGNSRLNYKWSVNGIPTNNALEQSVQVFRQNEGASGISRIGLSVENRTKILQYTSSSFNLVFGE